MRIGEVAKITGVTKDTIRLYEKMGLIKEASRPFEYNNYKDYNTDHVETIKMIIVMKELGLTLKECKEVIDSIESNKFDKEYANYLSHTLKETSADAHEDH